MLVRPLHLGVILLGVIEILQGAKVHLTATVQLILAIVAVILVLLDLLVIYSNRRVAP